MTLPSGIDEEWDHFVENAPGGDLVQSSAWASTKQASGLIADRCVVRDGGGQIVAGASLIAKRLAPRVAIGYVARGPLEVQTQMHASRAHEVLEGLLAVAKAHCVRYLVVQPPATGA